MPSFVSAIVSEDSFANNKRISGKPLYRCSSDHQRKFDYSITIGFVFGYVVCATSAVVVFYILLCTLSWTYSGKSNKKIKISEMIVLMVRRKYKRTQDHQILQFSYCGDTISVPLSQLCA